MDRTHKIRRTSRFYKLFSLVLILSIVFPMSYMNIKMFIVGLAALVGIVEANGEMNLSSKSSKWFISYILYNVVWILWGLLKDNPMEGIKLNLKTGILYTVIYFIFSLVIRSKYEMESVIQLIPILNLINAIFAFLFIMSSLTGLSITLLSTIMSNSMTEVTYGHMGGMGGYFINEMIFTTPFVIAKFFYDQNKNIVTYFNFLLSAVVILMCGRRVIQILFIIVMLLFALFHHGEEKIGKRALRIIGIVFVVFVVYQFYMYTVDLGLIPSYGISYRMQKAFEKSDDNKRYGQLFDLLNGFWENPIMGSGIAGTLKYGHIASLSKPWAFELSYFALLFHTGIIGFIWYISMLLIYLYFNCKFRGSIFWSI